MLVFKIKRPYSSLKMRWKPIIYDAKFIKELLTVLEKTTYQEFALMLSYMPEYGTSKGIVFESKSSYTTNKAYIRPFEDEMRMKNNKLAILLLEYILPEMRNISLPDLVDMLTIQSDTSLEYLQYSKELKVMYIIKYEVFMSYMKTNHCKSCSARTLFR